MVPVNRDSHLMHDVVDQAGVLSSLVSPDAAHVKGDSR
jgi:hypothetical protein